MLELFKEFANAGFVDVRLRIMSEAEVAEFARGLVDADCEAFHAGFTLMERGGVYVLVKGGREVRLGTVKAWARGAIARRMWWARQKYVARAYGRPCDENCAPDCDGGGPKFEAYRRPLVATGGQ